MMPSFHRNNKLKKGISRELIVEISRYKKEEAWMQELRLEAYDQFIRMPLPKTDVDLSALNFSEICYYYSPFDRSFRTWDEVPDEIKEIFRALAIPEYEQRLLAGVGTQFESEMLYKQMQEQWQDQGVIFCSMDDAVKEYPDLVQRYFGTVVPADDNKFAALNTAVWSGGSFIYVPPGVQISLPVHAFFRMQQEHMGQFERTLIIADTDSFVHYIEGCSAPLYTTNALHASVVEIVAHEKATVRYTTMQNWSHNVYNLVTKRAVAHKKASIEWIDGNFGSSVTMKYPCILLNGEESRGLIVSLVTAGDNQQQDCGAKCIHNAPRTRSQVISKSVIRGSGISSYRGFVSITSDAVEAISHVQCDALLLDDTACAFAYPFIDVAQQNCSVGHEASISAVDDAVLFYCMSRGITNQQARTLIIHGFVDGFVQELPLEYAVELSRLLALDVERMSHE